MEPLISESLQEKEKKLNSKILAITMLIRDKYPELYGFLGEMPVTIPDDNHPDINMEALKDYLDSLEATLKKYGIEHPLK